MSVIYPLHFHRRVDRLWTLREKHQRSSLRQLIVATVPERQTRAVAEFLTALDDEDSSVDRKPPKVISPVDPCSDWNRESEQARAVRVHPSSSNPVTNARRSRCALPT
jgi:hypothetical protein